MKFDCFNNIISIHVWVTGESLLNVIAIPDVMFLAYFLLCIYTPDPVSEKGEFVPAFDANFHRLESTAKEIPDIVWGRDHPLMEASISEDPRVLTHTLTR